jgi:uncharacterized OB-fold protein
MNAGASLITECPSCGRRFLPSRELCSACLLTRTLPTTPRATARVLSYSILQRAGSSAVIKPPTTIALLREEDDGASFAAPVEGEAAGLMIGETVDVRQRSWAVENGASFTGVVVMRRTA